ncbi:MULTISPECIES: hypothetical protein [unclassified Raoultella]|uniref:hypothetical protein n=1 Tax=unclassified Raoultella TaxID=2627600 RepID=UPI00135B5C9B|nr:MULTISPECIES: hypothetical protein [unclassified Raoultella]
MKYSEQIVKEWVEFSLLISEPVSAKLRHSMRKWIIHALTLKGEGMLEFTG